ncbi:TerD family protein [Nocardia panacis]|uniref:TerD family protein n=2 Tax=Nocardia panacis TaxID=2340916 RepID=A0A3A4KDP0_9NOCA|nr:TerD family protein [Nocardia panacis]
MGLGWDPVREWYRERAIDLNAAALLYSGTGLREVVYHERLDSPDGSVRLHGDSLDGVGPGDDEVISVDLTRLPGDITAILLLVTSHSEQTFAEVRNVFCRLVDGSTGAEIARYDPSGVPATGLVVGALVRASGGWEFREINEGVHARHPAEAVPYLTRYLT